MTEIYFAAPYYLEDSVVEWDWSARPLNVLSSFAYLNNWMKYCDSRISPASVMLDSGAYTFWKNGKTCDIDSLCDEASRAIYDRAVSLDVIGDHEASVANADYMLDKLGPMKSIPVFHIGEPWNVLDYYCSKWPLVGLSATAQRGRASVIPWLKQCFARRWPHRFHSFGSVKIELLMRFPFDTADASSWEMGALRFGHMHINTSIGIRGVTPVRGRLTPKGSQASALVMAHSWWNMQERLRKKWGHLLNDLRKEDL